MNNQSAFRTHSLRFLPAIRACAMAGALSLVSSAAFAQAKPLKARTDTVPAEYKPPAGMCRVWVDGVPAAQQPAPTDCPTAALKKPANGRIIYGEDPSKRKGEKTPEMPIKGLVPPVKKSPVDAAIPQMAAPLYPRKRDPLDDKRISDEQLFGDRPANSPASSYPGAFQPVYVGGVQQGGMTNGNGTVGVLGDPRYFNSNPSVKPPGYASGSCLDRDGDGWCDDLRFGPPVCLDKDKDGRCDDLPEFASQSYPQTLPRMRSALDVIEGRGSVEVARWLGTNEFTVRVPDQGSGVAPWRAIFLDAQNELLQVWTDRNRDGLAERVEIFRNGQRVKLIQR